MKTKLWIAILAAVLAVSLALSVFLLWPKQAQAVEVWSEGKLLRVLPLSVDTQLTVESANGTNVVTVRDGKVAVTEADCPDHYCMDRGWCAGGAQIVCLPNRLVLKFLQDQPIDGVTG